MVTGGLSANETLQHVLAHELVPDVAKTKLEDKVRRGEIPAKATLLRYGGTETPDAVIPSDFWDRQWRNVWIDYAINTASSRVFSPAMKPAETGSGMVPHYISDDNATGIAFSCPWGYIVWMAAGFKVTITHNTMPPEVWYAALPSEADVVAAVSERAHSTADESMSFDELTTEQVRNLGLSPGEIRSA